MYIRQKGIYGRINCLPKGRHNTVFGKLLQINGIASLTVGKAQYEQCGNAASCFQASFCQAYIIRSNIKFTVAGIFMWFNKESVTNQRQEICNKHNNNCRKQNIWNGMMRRREELPYQTSCNERWQYVSPPHISCTYFLMQTQLISGTLSSRIVNVVCMA